MRAYLSIIWNLILSPLFRFGLNKKKENKYRDDGDHRCYCCCRKGDHYRFLVRLERAQRKTHAISCLPYELPLHVIYFIFFLFHISVHDKTKRKIWALNQNILESSENDIKTEITYDDVEII